MNVRQAPLCRVCGKAIGVYEPLVALCEGEALETSRAAARDRRVRGELYHRDCYRQRGARSGEPAQPPEPVERRNAQIERRDGTSEGDGRQ